MGFENKYPYTDFHELNLDWILEQMKSLAAAWDAYQEELTGTNGEWPTFKNYIETSWATYQNNLTGPTGEWPTFKAAMELAWQQYQDSLTGVGGEWPTFKATMEGEWQDFFNTYLQTLGVVQTTGSSITDVMSQKAVTDELSIGADTTKTKIESVLNLYKKDNILEWESGYYKTTDGTIHQDIVGYYHTQPISKVLLNYMKNPNYLQDASSVSAFYALFKNGVFVGTLQPDGYHLPSGSITSSIDYDFFAINSYAPTDYYFLSKTRIILPNQEEVDRTNKLVFTITGTLASDEPIDNILFWGSLRTISTYGTYEGRISNLFKTTEPIEITITNTTTYTLLLCTADNLTDNINVTNVTSDPIIINPGYYRFIAVINNGGIYEPVTSDIVDGIYYFKKVVNPNDIKITEIIVTTPQELVDALEKQGSFYDRYKIIVKSGTYDIYNYLDTNGYTSADIIGKRGLELYDYVDLIGEGSVVIACTIPNGTVLSKIISTLNMHNTNNTIENIYFKATNTKYCIHDDSGFGNDNKKCIFKHCTIQHYGMTETDPQYSDNVPYGYAAGFVGGREVTFDKCTFDTVDGVSIYAHNQSGMTNPMIVNINNCIFNRNTRAAIRFNMFVSSSITGISAINNNYFINPSNIETEGLVPFKIVGAGNGNNITIVNTNTSEIYMN